MASQAIEYLLFIIPELNSHPVSLSGKNKDNIKKGSSNIGSPFKIFMTGKKEAELSYIATMAVMMIGSFIGCNWTATGSQKECNYNKSKDFFHDIVFKVYEF